MQVGSFQRFSAVAWDVRVNHVVIEKKWRSVIYRHISAENVTVLKEDFEYKRTKTSSPTSSPKNWKTEKTMQSNRNDDFIQTFGKKMRSSWRKKAFRIQFKPSQTAILMPVNVENSDRRYFNISVLIFMAFIGFISFSLISFYSFTPYNDAEISKTEELTEKTFEITPAEYSELVLRILSRLSKINVPS